MSDGPSDFSEVEAKALEAERLATGGVGSGHSFFGGHAKETEQQREFSRAAAAAIRELLRACQDAIRGQEARFEQLARNMDALNNLLETAEGQAQKSRDALQELREQQREQIQHMLDEQRVSLRQLALQTSEEAVLTDRARRATEARLAELSKRIDELGSGRSGEEK